MVEGVGGGGAGPARRRVCVSVRASRFAAASGLVWASEVGVGGLPVVRGGHDYDRLRPHEPSLLEPVDVVSAASRLARTARPPAALLPLAACTAATRHGPAAPRAQPACGARGGGPASRLSTERGWQMAARESLPAVSLSRRPSCTTGQATGQGSFDNETGC